MMVEITIVVVIAARAGGAVVIIVAWAIIANIMSMIII